jgi:hypothetical protein
VGCASLKGKRVAAGHGAFKRRGRSRGAARGARGSRPSEIDAAKLSVFLKLDDEPLPQQASHNAAVSRAEKVFSLDTTVESSLDASSQVDRQGDSSSVKLDAEPRLLRTRLAEHRLLRMQFLRQTRGKHRL